jgi:hypothetical protein
VLKFDDFLEPKEIEVTTLKGDVRKYVISMFPATEGREIIAGYPISAMPKIGDYKANEEMMLKLMSYVGIPHLSLPLSTKVLVDNHVPDWETLARIEYAMIDYNTSFFRDGVISNGLRTLAQKFLVSISPTLKVSLAQLLEQAKQLSTNLKQNTP